MSQATETLSQLETEVITFFVRGTQVLGLPKTVGEIFGLLYIAPAALSMDDIIRKLKISLGSASQGLRTLRSLRAVRVVYIPGSRRDHYEAETEFRTLVANFIRDEITPHLESGESQIERVRRLLDAAYDGGDPELIEWYRARIDKLGRLSGAAQHLVPMIVNFIKF